MIFIVVKVARSSGEAQRQDGGWEIWQILRIKEHFLTWIITYFPQHQGAYYNRGLKPEQGS